MTMDRNTFKHWHKPDDEPSELRVPPLCCASEFRHLLEVVEREHHRREDEAVHAERRRVLLDGIKAAEDYAEAVASVLDEGEARLATTVIRKALDQVRKAGCICPRLDIQQFGEPSGRTILGRDHRCGMHEKTEVER